MGDNVRITGPTLKVLMAIAEARGQELSGAEITKVTKLASGSLYPILYRLEDAGWLTANWEAGDPAELGRPRRRYYKVTTLGVRKTREAVKGLAQQVARLGWT